MIKKIIFAILALLIVAGATFYAINQKDNYDASKYYLKSTKGLEVGSQIDFKLPDQFDKTHTLSNKEKIMIFAFSKATGHTVREYFSAVDKGYLKSKNAVIVADVSKMPVFVRNAFALPDLKESSYSILLIYDKSIAKDLEKNLDKTKIVIAHLNNKKITKIEYASSQLELKKILEK